MNMTYVRVALYCLAPLIGMLPGVTVNSASMLIQIDVNAAIAGISAGGVLSAAVFKIWGKK